MTPLERIKNLCAMKNISITSLCLQVTGNKGNLATWKNNDGHMRSEYLLKCAKILDCSTDYLLGNDTSSVTQSDVCNPDTYVIAYLDLLGTKEFLKQNKEFNMYETLYRKYKDLSSMYNSGRKIKKIEFKVFSDNLIFAIKLGNCSTYSDEFEYRLQTLFYIVKSFQLEFLHDYGILLRGGITIGELFVDDIFVLGNGLVKAYNLENKIANFPRVVIDNSIIDNIDFATQCSPLLQSLLTNDTVNQITYINYLGGITSDNYYKEITEKISQNIIANKNNSEYLPKWEWLQNYNNSLYSNSYTTERIAADEIVSKPAAKRKNVRKS